MWGECVLHCNWTLGDCAALEANVMALMVSQCNGIDDGVAAHDGVRQRLVANAFVTHLVSQREA